MYVCICNAVTDADIRQAVEDGVQSMADLSRVLGVGSQCGRCRSCAQDCLEELLEEKPGLEGEAA
ncbi:MAG: (2Fe-2S)-binding protein [Gammaproteobacteria bacterium]